MSNSQTTTLRNDSPVGAWVAQHPQTADVFDMLKIDYCCGGDKPLENACWENGLEVLRVHSLLMAEEEQTLFPAIQQMESNAVPTNCDSGSIEQRIRLIRFEHQDIGDALKKARAASGDFPKPKDACPKYAQMYGLLRRVEKDVRVHVHKEEHILFPRAIELANRVGK